jgi:predicted P-loop ATPase
MTTTIHDKKRLVTEHARRGFQLLFYPTKTKGPTDKGWPQKRYTLDDYNAEDNVGVLLGTEIQPGKFLLDVDFDWPEGVPMASELLPPTQFGFGRDSRKISHAFYTTSTPQASFKFEDITGGRVFVELRGTKVDGTIGHQTMLPPSIHPSGEEVVMRMDASIAHDDTVVRWLALYATACILYSRLGPRGVVHDVRLALAGLLCNLGLKDNEVLAVGRAMARLAGNDVADMELACKSTLLKYRKGDKVTADKAMLQALGEGGKLVLNRIRDWLGESDFVHDKNDRIIASSQENIVRAIKKMNVKLTYDEFSRKPQMQFNGYAGPLNDLQTRHIWLKCEKQFGFRPPKDLFYDVAEDTATENKFHPVKQYLDNLKWDGVARLDEWLIKYAGAADNDYTRAVSALPLIAAVRRVRQPGCKFDELLVLESTVQGIGKSTALRSLCPREEWFSDDLPLDVDAKELIERTEGKWIIEAGELSGLRSSRTEHLKSMLSRQVDGPVRMAYGRLPVEVPRQFIVIGTTNDHTYLHDSTGNRRFWPVRVESFDVKSLILDRDQLWAEAAAREADDDSIRLPEILYPVANIQQERRRAEDPWETVLESVFAEEYQRLSPDEVWNALAIPIERRDDRGQRRVIQIMQKLGYRRMTVTCPQRKVKVKGWARGEGRRDTIDARQLDKDTLLHGEPPPAPNM